MSSLPMSPARRPARPTPRRVRFTTGTALLAIVLFIPPGPSSAQEADRVRSSLTAALGWLARHQSEDGRWAVHGFNQRCHPPASCAGPGYEEYDSGVTARYQEILDKHPDSAAAPKARERLKALPP